MVLLAVLAGAVAVAVAVATPAHAEDADGVDVSHHQGPIDWGQVAAAGERFAIMKATEGTTFADSRFNSNHSAAHAAGLYVAAYHFARPARSGGAAQANFLLDRARFAADGRNLPPALDLEETVDGPCSGLSAPQMVAWIRAFTDQVRARTGRNAIIYTRTNWWNQCTGGDGSFGDHPLWIARYNTGGPGALPAGWSGWTFWQYTSSGSVPGVSGNVDRNLVSGGEATLRALAGGGGPAPAPPADVVAVSMRAHTGTSEAHVLSRAAQFQAFALQTTTPLHQTDPQRFSWEVGDFNRDGVNDLYVISHFGGSGSTEVHVLNGADGYQSFLAHAATPLAHTSVSAFQFGVGDFDGDGADDLYALALHGASGSTEVHVLNAANHFQTWLFQTGSALHPTTVSGFQFGVGDFDGDRRDDVYAITQNNGRGNMETHVLSAASGFTEFVLHAVNPVHPITRETMRVEVGDVDGDGRDDVYLITYQGASGTTEVHVLSAASGTQAWVVHAASALHPTDQGGWTFAV